MNDDKILDNCLFIFNNDHQHYRRFGNIMPSHQSLSSGLRIQSIT